jgi:hypothetical protein
VQSETKMNNHNRSWTADIIYVLWNVSGRMHMNQLVQRLRNIRKETKSLEQLTPIVQSVLNNHTSQSHVWAKNGSRPEDDLFFSPGGKGTGEWALHKDRAAAWLKARGLPLDPVESLATDIARELVRQAVTAKNLDQKEWTESRIAEAAKALLDAQGKDGKIITIARGQF